MFFLVKMMLIVEAALEIHVHSETILTINSSALLALNAHVFFYEQNQFTSHSVKFVRYFFTVVDYCLYFTCKFLEITN